MAASSDPTETVIATQSPSEQALSTLLSGFPDARAAAVIDDAVVALAGTSPDPVKLSAVVHALFATAERVAGQTDDARVEQLVIDTPDGAVAAVRDGGLHAVALLRHRPGNIGLFLYELRSCLARVRLSVGG